MSMIPISEVGGNQFQKARELISQVVIINSCVFRVPSSGREERNHRVQLDDPEMPSTLSCTCEEGVMGRPCWAMARVLDVLEAFRAANVYISRSVLSPLCGLPDVAEALVPRARVVDGDVELELFWERQPEGGMLFVLP